MVDWDELTSLLYTELKVSSLRSQLGGELLEHKGQMDCQRRITGSQPAFDPPISQKATEGNRRPKFTRHRWRRGKGVGDRAAEPVLTWPIVSLASLGLRQGWVYSPNGIRLIGIAAICVQVILGVR